MRAKLGYAAVLAGVALAVAVAPAAADCGGVQAAQPKKHPKYRSPLAIGDSTMLLAMPNLARLGYEVNAHGCRGWTEGLKLLRERRHSKTLPHLVVMALGTDWSITPNEVRKALHVLGPDRMLGLVTPRELGGGAGSDADVVREEGKQRPRHVKVLDWVDYSGGHSSWFQPDGAHLTFSGARAFARLLRKALPLAPPH